MRKKLNGRDDGHHLGIGKADMYTKAEIIRQSKSDLLILAQLDTCNPPKVPDLRYAGNFLRIKRQRARQKTYPIPPSLVPRILHERRAVLCTRHLPSRTEIGRLSSAYFDVEVPEVVGSTLKAWAVCLESVDISTLK